MGHGAIHKSRIYGKKHSTVIQIPGNVACHISGSVVDPGRNNHRVVVD